MDIEIDKQTQRIVFVLPTFNEEDNIDSCIESLLSLKNEKIDVFDILVVNDGSKDDTYIFFY